MKTRHQLRKIADKLAHRLGYVRWDRTIQGEIEWKRDEQPYVNLTIPGGQRVSGWVDNRLPVMTHADNPLL